MIDKRLEIENELNENGLSKKYANIENLKMDIKNLNGFTPTLSKALLLKEIFCIINDKNILIFTDKETLVIALYLYNPMKITIREEDLYFLFSALNFSDTEKKIFLKKIYIYIKNKDYEIISLPYQVTFDSERIEILKIKTNQYILRKYNKKIDCLEKQANKIQENINFNLFKTIEILGIFVSIFTLISINANFFSTQNIDNIKNFLIINGTTVFSLSILLLLIYPKVATCIKILGILVFLISITITYIFI